MSSFPDSFGPRAHGGILSHTPKCHERYVSERAPTPGVDHRHVTPFEPEWEGYVTLEFSNTTPMAAKIYANEGVAQVCF